MNRIRLEDLADMVDKGKLKACPFCYRCNKIAYLSEQEARNQGKTLRSLGKGHTRVYQCPRNPDWWHLTSQKQRQHRPKPPSSKRKKNDKRFHTFHR
jgi:hypothetical protein|tara:strand:- start:446 stop:736 length:291 start_codon:yes stop_codon:yes gene_type:complete